MAPDHCNFVHAPIDSSTLTRCLKTPWFADLLVDPTLSTIKAPERQLEDQLGNVFYTNTLNTPDTIAVCQSILQSAQSIPSSRYSTQFPGSSTDSTFSAVDYVVMMDFAMGAVCAPSWTKQWARWCGHISGRSHTRRLSG